MSSTLALARGGGGGGGARGGGGGGGRVGGGGVASAGRVGGGGFSGAGRVGGSFGGGFRGGIGGYGYGRGFGYGYGYGRGFYGIGLGWGWPYWGYYGWPYYGYGYPYCDPYYYNCYGSYGYGAAYPAYGGYYGADPPAYGQPGYAQSAPPVVVNQNIPTPAQAPQNSQSFYRTADFYLIAFNDHSIRAATSYKVDGNDIVWISREGQEMRAPLSSVDVRFSEQINRDRRIDFRLP